MISPSLLAHCGANKADVDGCQLDVDRMIRKRKLVLLKPALGRAMVALDRVDFGDLLAHPLFRAQVPRLMQGDGGEFEFLKEGVDIISSSLLSSRGGGDGSQEEKVVSFYGSCLGERWRCELRWLWLWRRRLRDTRRPYWR